MVIIHGKGKDQPGKAASPVRDQLSKENVFFPVPVCALEFGLARGFGSPFSRCRYQIVVVRTCHLNVTRANYFLLNIIVACAGLFEYPTGRENNIAKNGWKLSKVEKIGSTRCYLAKNG